MTSEKFCLKWNDFQENMIGSLKELHGDLDFCDVTLACEGNHHIAASKVVLASSSPIFRDILKSNKHSYPLIYMKGTKKADLAAIVDFMYHGEANIFQEDIDSFLCLADELKLKGLSGSRPLQEDPGEEKILNIAKSVENFETLKAEQSKQETTTKGLEALLKSDTISPTNENFGALVATETSGKYFLSVNADFDNLSDKVNSIIERRNGIWTCNICEKTSTNNKKQDLKRHAETHIEGVSYPCNHCDKTLRCSKALEMHNKRTHPDK